MELLKKENWWIWLLLLFFSGGASVIMLGALFGCFRKDAWYAKPRNWIIGFVCFIFPFSIMMVIFFLQMLSLSCAKLEVPGKEIYLSPYIWLLTLIVPVIGWICFIVMALYLEIWTIVSLYRGNGERYLKHV